MEAIWDGAKGLLIKIMEMDGGYSQMTAFGQNLVQVFGTIMVGVLVWFLAHAFGKGEVGALIKVIVVCECVRIIA